MFRHRHRLALRDLGVGKQTIKNRDDDRAVLTKERSPTINIEPLTRRSTEIELFFYSSRFGGNLSLFFCLLHVGENKALFFFLGEKKVPNVVGDSDQIRFLKKKGILESVSMRWIIYRFRLLSIDVLVFFVFCFVSGLEDGPGFTICDAFSILFSSEPAHAQKIVREM